MLAWLLLGVDAVGRKDGKVCRSEGSRALVDGERGACLLAQVKLANIERGGIGNNVCYGFAPRSWCPVGMREFFSRV